MRFSRILPTALIVIALIPVAMPASADSDEPWIFEGGGWGHGVGLSQYGSQGMAKDGYDAEQIIDYYYSGAQVKTLGQVNGEGWLFGPEPIWVGISQNRTSQTFKAFGGPINVCLGTYGLASCEGVDFSLSSGDVLTVATVANTDPLRCVFTVNGGPPSEGDCQVDLTWTEAPTTTRVQTGGLVFARGSVHVRPNDYLDPENPSEFAATAFHVSVSVGLEKYLYGIAETLLQWEPAALQTQAIIARSYGVNKAMTSAKSTGELWSSRQILCWCHIGSTSSDQNYDGWDTDTEGSSTYGQKWRNAVNATDSKIVTHPQHNSGTTIVSTNYSSSNGGASEDNEDVWGGSALPWLRSVPDPWSADPDLNPLAEWAVQVTDEDLAAALGWDYALDAFIIAGPPGTQVRFTGKDNGAAVEKILNGTQIRSLLNSYGYIPGGTVRVSPYITAILDPSGFDDIRGNIFENAIDWLRAEQITLGCNPPANTLFCPNDSVTRGEMAVFISRAMSLPPAGADHFADDAGEFYEGAANRLYEAGITAGCGTNKFCGDQYLPREQMAVFLTRALGLPPSQVDHFIDDNSSPYESSINKIADAKITLGCNPPANDKFCPKDYVTRGQMAAFFKRAWG